MHMSLMNIYFHSPYLRVQQLGHMLDIEATLVETAQQFCIALIALRRPLVKFCAVCSLACEWYNHHLHHTFLYFFTLVARKEVHYDLNFHFSGGF